MKNILKILLIFFLLSATASAATFTGYYNLSQTLSSGQSLQLPEGAKIVKASVAGDVPEYQAWDENNISTYVNPQNIVGAYSFHGNANDISGNAKHFTVTNGIYTEGGISSNLVNTTVLGPLFADVDRNSEFYIYLTANWTGQTGTQRFFESSPNTANRIGITASSQRVSFGMWDGSTYYKAVSRNSVPAGIVEIYAYNNSTSFSMLVNGNAPDGTSGPSVSSVGMTTLLGNEADRRLNGVLKNLIISTVPIDSDTRAFYRNGFSGIQLNGEGYTGGTLTLSPTTSVQYVATDGVARTVSGSAEYTDNVTVLDETNDGYYYSVNLSHQAGSTVTSGTIIYDTGRPSLTGMEFSSTNPSATYATEGSLLIISTGALTSGDTYTYSFALPTYSVSGYVKCDEELNGIEGATVTLNGFSATTNATGYYVFPSVTNGTYTVTASKTGYDPASRQITVSGQDVTVDDLCIHFVTPEQVRVRNTISLFMAIGAILGAGLMIGAGMVFYTAMNGKSGVSFKQMKEIGYGAIFLIIFLLAVVMMGAAVYR